MAWNLGLDRPFGGGFEAFQPMTYLMYYPEVGARSTDAHSIYFEVLGEQGFVGLALFLALGWFALSACRRIVRLSAGRPDLAWAEGLGRMAQVSLIGYAVSGAFLGLAYFNFFYALLALIVGTQVAVERTLAHPASIAAQAKGPVAVPRGQHTHMDGRHGVRASTGILNPAELVRQIREWYSRL
jgi:O-antigen ligase